MSNNAAVLDSRQKGAFHAYMDRATIATHIIYPHPDDIDKFTLDTGYTLILDEGLATEIELTVGNGITLDTVAKSISITIDTTLIASGVYKGCLKSDSLVVGTYFLKGFHLYVADADC